MRKIVSISLFAVLLGVLPASAYVVEYFNTFYYNYLIYRNIRTEDMQNFDFLHKLSNSKIYWMEKSLNDPCACLDKEVLISMIDEEYYDLKENLDFEAEFVESRLLSKKQEKALKKAHKRFMRELHACMFCKDNYNANLH